MSPASQERRFRKEYAAELLRIAQADFQTAEFLLEGLVAGRIRGENFFFVIQQCLEKAIKAVLVHRELPVPLVNELGILVAKLPLTATRPLATRSPRSPSLQRCGATKKARLSGGRQKRRRPWNSEGQH